jgi:hypothetical protein
MDAIYTSAQLTFIAVADSDPSYGLPGVSKARSLSFRYERVGSAIVVYHPPACGWSITHSPWFSRAWTLQEGYLSRRRLYFTDSEVAFICNRSQFQEITSDVASGIDLLNGTVMSYKLSPQLSSLTHAIEMLTQYSPRKLSYDADALYAVTGILTHLSAAPDAVHSVWGVPFADALSEAVFPKLCIHWDHPDPTTRRQDFPSWSPLGWHGAAEFTTTRTQYTLSSDEMAGIREMRGLQPSSKRLKIRARMFRFPVVHIIWPDPPHLKGGPGEPSPHLVLPITDDTGANSSYNLYVPIRWDISHLSSVETTSALCAITSYEHVPRYNCKHFGIILLRPYAEHYERIGYARCFLANRAKSLGNRRCGPDTRTIMPLDDDNDDGDAGAYHWSPKGDHEVHWILEKEEETIVLV